jgi:tripartite-type tricarboxylate transporter receptor subunit TctC
MARYLGSMLRALAAGSLLFAASALAQNYPSKPIRMIVPYPAGGVADVTARIVGQKLGESLGQPVVIENRAGASGTLGANAVAKAPPDGYTLLLTPGDFVTMPSLMPPMPFDPNKDLVPITMVSRNPLLLVANSAAPFSNVKELLAAAKASPGTIGYSSPGNGTINHLAGEWFAIAGGVKFLHVPYRGGVASANGVAAGDVPFGVVSPSSGAALVDAGKVKAIALTGIERPSFAPAGWPTLAESGLPVDVVLWTGLFAPAGTPTAIVSRLEQEVGRILRDEGVRHLLNAAGIEASAIGQASFVERIRSEAARYVTIIEQTGIRVER